MPKVPTAPPVEPIYPKLDSDQGSDYRLAAIRDLENRLERERDERAKLYKKYRKAINDVDDFATFFVKLCSLVSFAL